MSHQTIIDPSLLLKSNTLSIVENMIEEVTDISFFVSQSFSDIVDYEILGQHYRDLELRREGVEPSERPDIGQNLYTYYYVRDPERAATHEDIQRVIEGVETIAAEQIEPSEYSEEDYTDAFTEWRFSSSDLRLPVLKEQFLFLFEKGQILSRVKRPFTEFQKTGAVMLDGGKTPIDRELSSQYYTDGGSDGDSSGNGWKNRIKQGLGGLGIATVLNTVKDFWLNKGHDLYVASSDVLSRLEGFLETVGIDAELSPDNLSKRLDTLASEVKEAKPEIGSELQELANQLGTVQVPEPAIAFLLLLLAVGKFSFVLVDP